MAGAFTCRAILPQACAARFNLNMQRSEALSIVRGARGSCAGMKLAREGVEEALEVSTEQWAETQSQEARGSQYGDSVIFPFFPEGTRCCPHQGPFTAAEAVSRA